MAYGELVDDFLEVVDPQKYCSFCCIPVLESSQYLKARILALDECQKVVELIGPNSLGKRGIQSVAKNLDDSSPDCRTSVISVLSIVRDKLHGDQARLFKACGSSLSNKGRTILEQVWGDQTRKQPELKQSAKNVAKGRRESHLSPPGSISKVRGTSNNPVSPKEGISLNLRLGESSNGSQFYSEDIKITSPNPFKFQDPSFVNEVLNADRSGTSKSSALVEIKNEPQSSPQVTKSDAAASLRARLKLIRERHRSTNLDDNNSRPATADTSLSSVSLREHHVKNNSKPLLDYTTLRASIKKCLETPLPLSEDNGNLKSCIESLRQLHTVVISPATESNVISLRKTFENNIADGIDDLTRFVISVSCYVECKYFLNLMKLLIFIGSLILVSNVAIQK